jgi:hypothetical protein
LINTERLHGAMMLFWAVPGVGARPREATMQEQPFPLIDTGDYPRIEAYEMGEGFLLPGGRARFLMADWTKIDGVWRRIVTGMLTRPLAGLQEDQALFWQEISRHPAPRTTPPLHH